MNEQDFFCEVEALIKQIDEAQTDNFIELLEIANVDFKQDLAEQTLSNIQLSKASLSQGNFAGVDFTGADLSEADLSQGNFADADFSGATLNEANLGQGNFANADFSGATLNEANLEQGNFANADFSGATLNEANLRQSNFTDADFTDASLNKANLGQSNFTNADFTNANLNETNTNGAVFNKAVLALARNLQAERLNVTQEITTDEPLGYSNRLVTEAKTLIEQKRYGVAESSLSRALAIREEYLGSEHLKVADGIHNLAVLSFLTEQYEKASMLFEKALALRVALSGPVLDVATNLNCLGLLHHKQSHYGRAEQFYRQSLEIRLRVLGDRHPDVVDVKRHINMLSQNKTRRSALTFGTASRDFRSSDW